MSQALLVLRPGQTVEQDWLHGLLWPEGSACSETCCRREAG
jgi:hypothetical protein